jgi:uncharacterized membrane protein
MAVLRLWPHRSLTAQGFVWFIGLTAAMIALPLIGVLGSPTLWGLLPFLVATVAGVWWALRRSARDGQLTEVLSLWPDRVELVRTDPRGERKVWQAEPYWVRVEMHVTGGPVENYLTLKGGGREVEIGAFLSPEERTDLRGELVAALGRVR